MRALDFPSLRKARMRYDVLVRALRKLSFAPSEVSAGKSLLYKRKSKKRDEVGKARPPRTFD